MEQNQNQYENSRPPYPPAQPWPPYEAPKPPYQPQPQPCFPAEKREWWMACAAALSGLALANGLIFGGGDLGFALAMMLSIVFASAYLWRSGKKPGAYSVTLLSISLVIAAGFVRSNDGFVKFVMLLFILLAVNLGLCIQSGQNRRLATGFTTLLDGPRALFALGFGSMAPAFRGLFRGRTGENADRKKTGAVLLGLAITVPVLLIVLPLLISADAAFEGFVDLLPDFELGEIFVTAVLGGGVACVLYTRSAALRHAPRKEAAKRRPGRVNPWTVNTVLIGLCVVYVAYLLSQLAYFAGGFSGVLPEGYNMAEYARRGFFEMAWLCVINLSIIALTVGLVEKGTRTPLATRIFCLFIGFVTVFFVITASAKMGLYIGAYGLTRLRVLTEVIMVFLGLATLTVCVWLFVPRLPYMKVILILALVMGATVLWADVDTVVAAYNVRAYQNGALQSVDVNYLTGLSSGAVPYIIELAEDGNQAARDWLAEESRMYYWCGDHHDLRSWNIADWLAGKLLEAWHTGK
ncbi:MAG: DUF4173 domain-containing protein [Ruminococcaceae bacterium]|nr:DUF4173 domain-containing protein [Oscillospiraceae bacterium]